MIELITDNFTVRIIDCKTQLGYEIYTLEGDTLRVVGLYLNGYCLEGDIGHIPYLGKPLELFRVKRRIDFKVKIEACKPQLGLS